jgi:glycosyltransferase involved in cell wall biosynthesis
MSYSVTAIVPVYNEEITVGLVVTALLSSSVFEEVICVDDRSTILLDILKSFGHRIKFIGLPKNKGKGYAMAQV